MKPRYWFGLNRYIHPLGFGCWQLAGDYFIKGKPHGWGEIKKDEAIHLIHKALDGGVQFFDTATSYGNGLSEEVLGEAINTYTSGDHAVVCTKIALTEKEIKNRKIGQNFEKEVEKSLKRLKLDIIDVLLIHNPPDELNWSEFDTRILDDLRKKGKIGTYGISCRSLAGVKNVVMYNFGTCLQWVFNLLERRPVADIFPQLKEVRMNFIARSPLARGLISSKYLNDKPVFSDNSFRSTLSDNWINWTLHSIRRLESASSYQGSMSCLAIRYCLSFEDMSVVIPGIRKMKYLEDFFMAADEGELESILIEEIESSINTHYPGWA